MSAEQSKPIQNNPEDQRQLHDPYLTIDLRDRVTGLVYHETVARVSNPRLSESYQVLLEELRSKL